MNKELRQLLSENILNRYDNEEYWEQEIIDQWKEEHPEEVCPHCNIILKSKMFDIDGTNLEEHKVCEECGFGSPSLK